MPWLKWFFLHAPSLLKILDYYLRRSLTIREPVLSIDSGK